MKVKDWFWLELKSGADVNLFLFDPEYEIFVPMFMWPKAPAITRIRKDDGANDIRVQQNVLIKNKKDCMERVDYSSKYF